MAKKLGIGDTFPNVTLNLVKGGSVTLPAEIGAEVRRGAVLSRPLVTILSPAVGRLRKAQG